MFVNLPLSWVARDVRWLRMFITRGIAPELGMDTTAVQDLPESWHRDTARRLREAGLACAVHLPFFDLHPGSFNDAVLRASRETLERAASLAQVYGPKHMVGHVAWDGSQHAAAPEKWLERSLATWEGVLAACEAKLWLENTHEREPGRVRSVVDGLPASRAGICFDAGHWFSFARGAARDDMDRWLDAFAPRLAHLHLHDNDGSGDQHLGMGEGSIPWEALFAGLEARGVRPTATLEPHDEAGFETSLAWLAAHPEVAGRFAGDAV